MFEHAFLAVSILANILLLIPISLAFVDGFRLFAAKKGATQQEMNDLALALHMDNGRMIAEFLKRDGNE